MSDAGAYSSEYELVLSTDSDDLEEPGPDPLTEALEQYIGQFCWKDRLLGDESRVYLHIDVSNVITEITGTAWGIEISAPVTVKMVMKTSDYRGSWRLPKVEVFQFDENGKLYQLECILQRFLECLWVLGKEIPWDQRYMDRYEEEITGYLAYIEDPCDAVLLHRLYKADLDLGLEFYSRKDGNLFNLMREYLIYRLPTICRYCVHCDETPIFLQGKDLQLLKPFVCGNQLCHFQLSQLKMGDGVAGGITGSANLTHLLAMMTVFAAKSTRWRQKILKPFPALVSKEDPTEMFLNPDEPNFELLEAVVESIPIEREAYTKTDGREFREQIEAIHPYGNDLLQWIISSNRAHIIDVPEELTIPNVGTSEQYLMLLDSPTKEEAFQALKAQHGTVYAFHGSNFMNYHSILRNGLYNASGTELQRNGKAHGNGIYLSPSLNFALSYCKDRQGYRCLALCEVINDGLNKKTSRIWTIEDSLKVCTRLLLVYKPKQTVKSGRAQSTSPELLEAIQAIYAYFGMISYKNDLT